jgi:hypothetical protein
MLAAERQRRNQRQMERRAKPARRSSRFMYPKTAAPRLHQSRSVPKNQNPQNGHLMARFDWGFGAICFGASPVAAVFGSAPGNATSPKHRIHSNPAPPAAPSKPDISTLLGIGHFYFALTKRRIETVVVEAIHDELAPLLAQGAIVLGEYRAINTGSSDWVDAGSSPCWGSSSTSKNPRGVFKGTQ